MHMVDECFYFKILDCNKIVDKVLTGHFFHPVILLKLTKSPEQTAGNGSFFKTLVVIQVCSYNGRRLEFVFYAVKSGSQNRSKSKVGVGCGASGTNLRTGGFAPFSGYTYKGGTVIVNPSRCSTGAKELG